jgi:hypothetical protein
MLLCQCVGLPVRVFRAGVSLTGFPLWASLTFLCACSRWSSVPACAVIRGTDCAMGGVDSVMRNSIF